MCIYTYIYILISPDLACYDPFAFPCDFRFPLTLKLLLPPMDPQIPLNTFCEDAAPVDGELALRELREHRLKIDLLHCPSDARAHLCMVSLGHCKMATFQKLKALFRGNHTKELRILGYTQGFLCIWKSRESDPLIAC